MSAGTLDGRGVSTLVESGLEHMDTMIDPLDSVGRRCAAAHSSGLRCHRRHDHVALGDPYHYAMTAWDAASHSGHYWRWA